MLTKVEIPRAVQSLSIIGFPRIWRFKGPRVALMGRDKVLGTYKSEAKLGTLCRHSRNVKRPLEERFVANVTCGESYPAISPLWLGSRGHMGPPLAGAFLAPRRC